MTNLPRHSPPPDPRSSPLDPAPSADAVPEFELASPGLDEHARRSTERIVDGEADSGEWSRFVERADALPRLWRELAFEQRDARLLGDALARQLDDSALDLTLLDRQGLREGRSSADLLPQGGSLPFRGRSPGDRRMRLRDSRLGWGMAACIAGAWVLSAGLGSQRAAESNEPAIQPAAFLNPTQALEAYLALGRESGSVVGELPGKPIIERRSLGEGEGFEVVFVRQIIEKGRVPALFSFERTNEFGDTVPAPLPPGKNGRHSL